MGEKIYKPDIGENIEAACISALTKGCNYVLHEGGIYKIEITTVFTGDVVINKGSGRNQPDIQFAYKRMENEYD